MGEDMHTPLATAGVRYPLPRLLALTVGLLGLQFCWAVQVGYVTKTLLELGLAERFVSYAWLAGPVAGIVMQPLVGVLSDRCRSRWGRRRPFIAIGAALSAVLLLAFAWAERLWVAVLAFWGLDFAINAAQGPLRALLTDVVPPPQQAQGNACFALMTGLGNAAGNFLGSLPLGRMLIGPDVEDIKVLYGIAAFVLLTSVGICIFVTRENVYISRNADEGYEMLNGRRGEFEEQEPPEERALSPALRKAMQNAPGPFWRVFTVQCFTWFAWFSVFVFATSWVGAEVYQGNPKAGVGSPARKTFDEGVRLGNLGLGIQALVSIGFSVVLPSLIEKCGIQNVYFASHMLQGLAMASTVFIVGRHLSFAAVFVISVLGIPWATTMTIPWAIMGASVARVAPELAGLYATIFNLAQCFPEIAVSLLSEVMLRFFGTEAAVIGMGGITAFFGGILIVILRIDDGNHV